MSRVLVTGGAGYIGSALIPLLDDAGYDVTVLDDFRLSSPRNLMDMPAFEFVRGDVRDREAVDRAMDGVDHVVHLAAITGAQRTHEMRETTFDVNVGGTETVVASAEAHDVDRMVLASSCNVYGDAYETDMDEETDPAPPNPYAESKLEAERVCRESSIPSVALRMATNFGDSPGVRFNLVVNTFTFRAAMDEPLTVYGDGENWRPFVHVHDSARAYRDALEWPAGVYNVGHENYRIEEIAEAVAEVVGRDVPITYLGDEDPGPSYHVSFDKLSTVPYEPRKSLRAGVESLANRFP